MQAVMWPCLHSEEPFSMQALAESDTVVEAIREDEAIKCTAFSLLDTVRPTMQSPLLRAVV